MRGENESPRTARCDALGWSSATASDWTLTTFSLRYKEHDSLAARRTYAHYIRTSPENHKAWSCDTARITIEPRPPGAVSWQLVTSWSGNSLSRASHLPIEPDCPTVRRWVAKCSAVSNDSGPTDRTTGRHGGARDHASLKGRIESCSFYPNDRDTTSSLAPCFQHGATDLRNLDRSGMHPLRSYSAPS